MVQFPNLNVGGHEVQHLDGSPINWKKAPAHNAMVRWSKKDTSGRTVTGSLRTIAHFNRLNNLAHNKFRSGLSIIQGPFHTGVAASAGTHDKDACADVYIPGVDWWRAQAFLRANGFGCWVRQPPAFPWHIHGFTVPPQSGTVRADDFRDSHFTVGLYVDGGISEYGSARSSSQLTDWYNEAFGLSGQHTPHSDHSWFPPDKAKVIFRLDPYIKARARRS